MTLAEKLLLVSGDKPNGYIEFVSSTPMTITPKYTNSGVTLQYSLDAESWMTVSSGEKTPSANVIYFRGMVTETKSLYASTSVSNAWTFKGATNLECNGKLDRLIQSSLGGDSDVIELGSYCFYFMFYGAITLIKAPELPSTTLGYSCYNNMFNGCTSLTTAPELPAATLTNYCYTAMFRGCSGLITAPALPATALTFGCYNSMFMECINLKLSTTKTGIYDTAYGIPTVGTGTTSAGALSDMFKGTGGTFTGTPEINTTYYTENTPV